MQTKGFTGNKNYIETPNDIRVSEKTLKTYKNNQKGSTLTILNQN